MASFFSGDGRAQKLGSRLSGALLNPGRTTLPRLPVAEPRPPATESNFDPQRIIPADERKEAMSGLDPVETKWTQRALIVAVLTSILVVILVSVQHTTKKVHGKTIPTSGVTTGALLIAGIVVAFAILGYFALRRNRRTLVVFAIFIIGFACALAAGPLGFAFILFGGWLMLRAYRVQKYGTPNAKLAATQAAARPPRRERKAAATTVTARPTGYKAPKASKRYTPKQPARKKVPKPAE
jgi:hypothetical protein